MDYEEFKLVIRAELQKNYQEEAEIEISEVLKNNGRSYDGIRITLGKECRNPTPIIDLSSFYEDYYNGKFDIAGCVEEIMEERNNHVCPEGLDEFAGKIVDWEYVKENVYPILLSTKENKQMLKNLVSIPLLDLSVGYIIRDDVMEECRSSAKITKPMLKCYGVNKEQLHKQAIENLNKDGYQFQNMNELIKCLRGTVEDGEELASGMEMYVLTNTSKLYGAAGILSQQLLKNFAGERDFFILPSSVHECIFVPVVDMGAKGAFDMMVREVNTEEVGVEERLSDHCYYYDAKENEIRMCA